MRRVLNHTMPCCHLPNRVESPWQQQGQSHNSTTLCRVLPHGRTVVAALLDLMLALRCVASSVPLCLCAQLHASPAQRVLSRSHRNHGVTMCHHVSSCIITCHHVSSCVITCCHMSSCGIMCYHVSLCVIMCHHVSCSPRQQHALRPTFGV